jgi:hypothetical protein
MGRKRDIGSHRRRWIRGAACAAVGSLTLTAVAAAENTSIDNEWFDVGNNSWQFGDSDGFSLKEAWAGSGPVGRAADPNLGRECGDDALDNVWIYVDGHKYRAGDGFADVTRPGGDLLVSGPVRPNFEDTGLDVSAAWRIIDGGRTARLVGTFTNPGGAPVSPTIRFFGNLGSDSFTVLRHTSTDDATFTADDRWAVTSGRSTNPALFYGLQGDPEAVRSPHTVVQAFVSPKDVIDLEYSLTVAAGETVRLMWFVGIVGFPSPCQVDQDAAVAEALNLAIRFDDPGAAGLLVGLTDDIARSIANWDVSVPDSSRRRPSFPPVTEPPVTEPPVTDPPVTDPPVTDPPVTDPPVTEPTDPLVAGEPGRVFDSRVGGPKVSAGSFFEVSVAGVGDVPVDAAAVVLNVAVIDAEASGFVSVVPAGTLRSGEEPETSNVNYDASAAPAISNTVIVPIGDDGSIELYASMTAHVVVDVLGHIPAGANYQTLNQPRRVLDTRGDGSDPDGSGKGHAVDVVGDFGPDDATLVIVNVTLVNTVDSGGYVTVWPTGSAMPPTSNLNTFGAGQTRAGLVIVPIGEANNINVRSDVDGDLIVDVFGYLGDTEGSEIDPSSRVYDTRPDGRLAAGEVRTVQVAGVQNVPTGASFVLANVTAVEATNAGFVSVLAAGTLGDAQPDTSNLNYPAGGTIANTVLVSLGDGSIEVYTQSSIHLIVDILAAF